MTSVNVSHQHWTHKSGYVKMGPAVAHFLRRAEA